MSTTIPLRYNGETIASISEFPNYFVSTSGYIFNSNMKRISFGKCGEYPTVRLTKNGKRVHKLVHRIVAKAFIPNHYNKPCVNHMDGIKNNNDSSNLEWSTHKENMRHAIETDLRKIVKTCKLPPKRKMPMCDEDIRQMILERKSGCSLLSLSKKYNIAVQSVYRIASGKRHKNIMEK
jgi:hypothetical protein